MQNALKVSFGVTKRAFTIAVVVATLAWSVAATFAIAPRMASAANSGDLVKGSLPAVYYVGSDMKRYVFTNDKAYFTWYTDFSTVKKISDTELAAITIGGNVTYKPGVKMIKIQSDPKVYAVAHGGVLRWVSTEAAAVALYGANWNTKIDDISDAFFTNYTVGSQISSASDYVIANEQTNSPTINADKGLAGGGALNVTLASDNPAGATITQNAQGVNLLKVNIAGTGTITGLTFTRLGAGIAADWANVYLYDGDTRLTTGRSVSSTTNQVVFNNLNVAVSGSKELTLVGDLTCTGGVGCPNAHGIAGNAHYFSLSAATDVVASATVGGTFPVAGNQFSISGSLGGSVGIVVGSTASNPKLGQTGVELANFKLNAGGVEDISLRRLVLTNSGAASLANLGNLAITAGGVVVAQNPIISGSTATFVFAVPYVLAKGITRVFSVTGDIMAGNRAGVDTIHFYVDQTYDIYATGNTYGAGVNVTNAYTSALANGGVALVIQGGQITFAFNGPTTGDISVGANDAVIEKFAITSVNHVEVRNLNMQINANATLADVDPGAPVVNAIPSITDCKVKNTDTGVTLTNQFDLAAWTDGAANGATIFGKNFTDRFEINAGQTLNLALTCDVLSTAPALLAGRSLTGTVVARVLGDIRNLDSNTDVQVADIVPASALIGNPQTIRVSGLTVGVASSPSSATVTKGSTVNAVGLNFTAGSASDVKVTQIKLRGLINLDATNTYATASNSHTVIGHGGGDVATAHSVQDVIQSATIWDGTTQLGVAQSPDVNGDMNFTNLTWSVPAGTTKTVTVSAVLSNNLPYGVDANRFLIDMIGAGLADTTTANVTAQDKDSNTVNATNAVWTAANVHLNKGTAGAFAVATTVTTADAIAITGVRSGSLQVQIDGDTPVAALATANTSDNASTRIKFTSINEKFSVTRLTVQDTIAGTSRSITSVRLFDKNGTLFCSGALDSNSRLRCANDAGLFVVDGNHVVTVKMNIDQEGSGTTGANSGDAPRLALYASDAAADAFTDDIKAVGVSSGTALQDADARVTGDTAASAGGITFAAAPLKIFYNDAITAYVADNYSAGGFVAALVTGNEQVIRKTQPTVATIAGSTTLTANPTVYKFSVTAASNADVAIKRFNLDESNVGVILDGFRVYENDTLLDPAQYSVCTGGNENADVLACTTNIYNTGGGNQILANAAATVTVYFTSERVVSAGTTKTFRIDCAVTGAAAGKSVTFKLKDDSGAAVVSTAIENAALDTANFVWSDTSADAHTTAHGSGNTDWTNGKYVKTLPTNPQTLSL